MRNRHTIVLLAGLFLAAPLQAAEPETSELWFQVLLQNQPAGYMHTKTTETDDRITLATNMSISLKRLGSDVTVDVESTMVETPDGKPVSMKIVTDMAMTSKTTEVTFGPDATTMVNTQGTRTNTRKLPAYDGSWMPPAAAGRYVTEQYEAGNKAFSYTTIDPMSGIEPLETNIKIYGEEMVEVGGKVVPAIRMGSTLSKMPTMEIITHFDSDIQPLRTSVDMGFMQMVLERADKEIALAERSAPEMMLDTTITPNKPISSPRKLRRATYVLQTPDPLPELPTIGVQTVKRIDDRTLRVTVDLDAAPAQTNDRPAVTHNSNIDGKDPRIIALKDEATHGLGDDPAERAEAMRRFVYDYIDEKSLGVGFATATEVAQTGQGDCSEHGVLLAAMLRADGIPARVASGLVYVDSTDQFQNIFGYHMWTQAYLDGAWVDLDATMGSKGAYDATHITINTSNMDEDKWVNDMVTMIPLIGKLEVEVVKP